MAKKRELDSLLQAKAELETHLRVAEADADDDEPTPAPAPALPKLTPMADVATEVPSNDELRSIMEHRQRAQEAVEAQERKLSELTALQSALRSRLNELEHDQAGEEEQEAQAASSVQQLQAMKQRMLMQQAAAAAPAGKQAWVDDDDDDDEVGDDDDAEEVAGKLLELISMKTQECEKLATVVEEARNAGMKADNPRLQAAERNLALRYAEVKKLAEMADKLGLSMQDEEEEENDDDGNDGGHNLAMVTEQPAQLQARLQQAEAAHDAALAKAQRLKLELENCVQQLQQIDGHASHQVAQHPAFRRMRGSVQQKLQALHAQMQDAVDVYEREPAPARDHNPTAFSLCLRFNPCAPTCTPQVRATLTRRRRWRCKHTRRRALSRRWT
mmetsp:Transcript_34948/g.96549  ORF Transcript_34948/g.96549 Transcript_34948/m.96549 type:complete len:387 (-) Transcript_34948:649-1809(-)